MLYFSYNREELTFFLEQSKLPATVGFKSTATKHPISKQRKICKSRTDPAVYCAKAKLKGPDAALVIISQRCCLEHIHQITRIGSAVAGHVGGRSELA